MEAGLWLLILGSAFGLMAWAFVTASTKGRTNGVSLFQIMAGALFMLLYILGSSGEEVEATSTVTDGTTTWTETKVLIPGGETSAYIGYMFMGLGVFNFVIILRHFWEGV